MNFSLEFHHYKGLRDFFQSLQLSSKPLSIYSVLFNLSKSEMSNYLKWSFNMSTQ